MKYFLDSASHLPENGSCNLRQSGQVVLRMLMGAVLVLAISFGACSSDRSAVPVNPMISDVGSFIASHDFEDGSYGEYKYEYVTFEGDIMVSEYEEAAQRVSAVSNGDQTVIKVKNYRRFPPSQRAASSASQFALFGCAEANFDSCMGGRIYVFTAEGDSLVLSGGVGFWVGH